MAVSSRTRATANGRPRQTSSSQQPEDVTEEALFVPGRIQKFRAAAEEHGWEWAEDWYGEDYRVKAWRGEDAEERILMIWRDRYFSASESWYELVDVRSKIINNQAEAVRFVCDQPDYTHAKNEDGKNRVIRNVFDFSEFTDEEVVRQLNGAKLTWQNGLSTEYETGHVPRRGRHTFVGQSTEGRRYISFADADGTGFRCVALDAISKIK